MERDFVQVEWDAALAENCRKLVRLAILEDLDRSYDWTTTLLAPPEAVGKARVVARQAGVIAGLAAASIVLEEYDPTLQWRPFAVDGQGVRPGQALGEIEGSARSLLAAERVLLNFVGHLSGIASLTARFVAAVHGTTARIYDTRKTIPGWRWLEKYAVRQGGGHNHRRGLYDAVLIKDNHLAFAAERSLAPAAAVALVRRFQKELPESDPRRRMIIEVEVDTLEQLWEVLPAGPDLVLLDNMSLDDLRSAVTIRDQTAPGVELEASGGVNLSTVAAIAATGVERISSGALTHSAACLDVALDWVWNNR